MRIVVLSRSYISNARRISENKEMKTLGKLLNLIGVLAVVFAAVYQVYLNYAEFGKWYSGYIIIHWSLAGLLGVFLLSIGYGMIEWSGKKRKDKEKKE